MRKIVLTMAAATIAAGTMTFAAVPAAAQAAADKPDLTPSGHYSVETTRVSFLLDDPAAAAVLEKLIPTVYANDMFKTMGRDQTLKAIQQYEPGPLSDENLAKIQAEFDKLPPKK